MVNSSFCVRATLAFNGLTSVTCLFFLFLRAEGNNICLVDIARRAIIKGDSKGMKVLCKQFFFSAEGR